MTTARGTFLTGLRYHAAMTDSLTRPESVARAVALAPAEFIDSDHPAIRAEAARVAAGIADPAAKARALYGAVRDRIRYDVYLDFTDREIFRASSVLKAGRGYCVGKASLFGALLRASGIPAEIGLADVRNHLSSPKLLALMGTDLFAYHGYVALEIGGRRIKATPVFNASLCEKLGAALLDFDGEHDALMQPVDRDGREFMEYVADHGSFFDVPVKFLLAEMARLYPALTRPGGVRGSLEAEAQPIG